MAPRLWIMTTLSSANINPLQRQLVKGREIIVTEEPWLHLVWIHDCIFIKPMPRYLLSQAFWAIDLWKAATGFVRTYRYLIQHESDFNIAQQEHLRLIPKDVEWALFCQFISELDHIEDSAVSRRYWYGELRLTRLNFYALLLLGKFYSEQVALASEQLMTAHWEPLWYVSRWFSIVSLLGAAIVLMWFVLLWLWIFLDEWIYTFLSILLGCLRKLIHWKGGAGAYG
ncbi:hypothetical protein BCR34DRAFT_621770 [Clohesyomyces aquaticus]|uniref:Uncharacterized protein n=1 Tax=Clohesyomyces aquaticus TaxID=1231657 RepID=A0A1Y2A4Z5_9PLEO|nr:hypothetical protein BCR34DRAFT_621770 [Clohesyomyces aquaticus]